MPCPHKAKVLTCSRCSARVCAACVQLESHACPGLAARVAEERALLDKKLVKVVAVKVAKL
jgi:hypothetical protein